MDLVIVINMPWNKPFGFDANKVVFDGVLLLLLPPPPRSRSVYRFLPTFVQVFFNWKSVAELEFVMKLVFLR